MKRLIATIGCAMGIAGFAWAAAPVLNVSKSVTIAAPVTQVWDSIKNFNALNSWHPAVATDEIVSGKNNEIGAVRLLTLKGGGTIKEKLLDFQPSTHRFKYSILEGVLPVSDYTSVVEVKSIDAHHTQVTWSGEFKRKNVGDHPADNENDKTATDTMGGVYQGGLDNLKKTLEAK